MTLETATPAHRDVSEQHHLAAEQVSQRFGLDMASPEFNKSYDAAKSKAGAQAKITPETAAALKGIEVKNIDASPEFAKQTKEAFEQAFSRLNPEVQKALKGLKVESGSHLSKMIPHSKDEPARTTDPQDHLGRMMAFSEKGVQSDKGHVKDVMNHEIWHAVEDVTKGSKDPELRKAIDLGISRLSKVEQSHIAAHGEIERDRRYSELGGDILALETGSKQKDLAYVTNLTKPYDNFKEAREIIRRKYLRHEDN